MSRRVLRYLPQARAEYREQRAYYKALDPRLRVPFEAAIRRAEDLALGNPEGFAYIIGSKRIRAVILRRFPYRLLYVVQGNDVVVVALAHTARDPGQFQKR
ncbi:MAG: type II toxin-antitoxin system RelE/ParE family toxin [Burkholderiaceae bacterium]